MLTTLLDAALPASTLLRHVPEPRRPRRTLAALLLLLEVGMLGTFLALDLVLFFVFFEVVLMPMWFVIARLGRPHDAPAPAAPQQFCSTRCSARR